MTSYNTMALDCLSIVIGLVVRKTLEDYRDDFARRWGTGGDMYKQICFLLTLEDEALANLGEIVPGLIAGGHTSCVNRLMTELTKLWKED